MAKKTQMKSAAPTKPECSFGEMNILVLQGGGALGSYQAGAYAALHDAGYEPEWLAGISIGSINAAIIAGNPRDKRVEKLRQFWETVSSGLQAPAFLPGEIGRKFFNESSAFMAAAMGVDGFFTPHFPVSLLNPFRPTNIVSYYDSSPLRDTLLELVDFDYLNSGKTRLSVGTVNVRTGNFVYFDTKDQRIEPEHIMASGALPPGLPPVEIEGELYWDGGLVSNTPLQHVMDHMGRKEDTCIFQVDLYCAEGEVPTNLLDVAERESDIRYSSRTRLNTSVFKQVQTMKRSVQHLLSRLPKEFHEDPDFQRLQDWSCESAVTIVHLINRRKVLQSSSKDYEFSRVSMEERWNDGIEDALHTLNHPKWLNREIPKTGIKTFDLNEPTVAELKAKK